MRLMEFKFDLEGEEGGNIKKNDINKIIPITDEIINNYLRNNNYAYDEKINGYRLVIDNYERIIQYEYDKKYLYLNAYLIDNNVQSNNSKINELTNDSNFFFEINNLIVKKIRVNNVLVIRKGSKKVSKIGKIRKKRFLFF